jgi:hypothetical protein
MRSESRLGAFFRVFRPAFVPLTPYPSPSSCGGDADCRETLSLEPVREGRRRVRDVSAGWAPEA